MFDIQRGIIRKSLVIFFWGGLCNDIKVNGRFELKLRVSNDHCLMFVEREDDANGLKRF